MLWCYVYRSSWGLEMANQYGALMQDRLSPAGMSKKDFPDAEKIVCVCDNLNMHNILLLYEAVESEEARQLWEYSEMHHILIYG